MMKRFYFLGIALIFVMSGCSDDVVSTSGSLDNSLSTQERINQFIIGGVSTYYLWESETDWSRYDKDVYSSYFNPYNLFDELVYEDDSWSSLTSNIGGLTDQMNNISKTFGYYLMLYRNPFVFNNEAVAVVLYTIPGSPAANAGLRRGDIIVEINGSKITSDNYTQLNSASIVLRCGTLDDDAGMIVLSPETKELTAVEMYEDPVNAYKIIEEEGHKIGYLCYTGYQRDSEDELVRIFTEFKSAGVSDVVLDLRYNTGGYARTAIILSSILAPKSAVENKSVYLERHYNNLYATYLESQEIELHETFTDTLPVNMDLSRLYVLTSSRTASASESTIVGLKPYLDITLIGETTSGKYCGGILLSPEGLYGQNQSSYYSDFSNWGMYIMIYRFANIYGISSFTGGLVPDILANEGDLDLKPFGDKDDPLLGRAIAQIVGRDYIESRSSTEALEPLFSLPDMKSHGMLDSFIKQ